MSQRFLPAVLTGAVAAALLAVGGPVRGQGRSVWDAVFSDAQAARGGPVYDSKCSGCHEKDLTGTGMAGELAGPTFRKNYDGTTLSDLFGRVRETMPADAPGSMTPQECAEVVSYMLLKNGYPAGSTDLPLDAAELASIKMLASKP